MTEWQRFSSCFQIINSFVFFLLSPIICLVSVYFCLNFCYFLPFPPFCGIDHQLPDETMEEYGSFCILSHSKVQRLKNLPNKMCIFPMSLRWLNDYLNVIRKNKKIYKIINRNHKNSFISVDHQNERSANRSFQNHPFGIWPSNVTGLTLA